MSYSSASHCMLMNNETCACLERNLQQVSSDRDRRSPFPIFIVVLASWLMAVASRSKAWTFFVCSNARVVCSNPIRGIDNCVCLFCFCVILGVANRLATGWSPVLDILLNVYRTKRLKKLSRPNNWLYSRNRNSVQFNSVLVDIRANLRAQKPITKLARVKK
jgi:hypothetical protein